MYTLIIVNNITNNVGVTVLVASAVLCDGSLPVVVADNDKEYCAGALVQKCCLLPQCSAISVYR